MNVHAKINDGYLLCTADSYVELWQVQRSALATLRGADTGSPFAIPRTTHADVVQLSAFWDLALTKAGHRWLAPAPEPAVVSAFNGVRRRWRAALANVDVHARTHDPHDIYPNNLELWCAISLVSTTIAAIDDLPLNLDLAVNGVEAARRGLLTFSRGGDLPERVRPRGRGS